MFLLISQYKFDKSMLKYKISRPNRTTNISKIARDAFVRQYTPMGGNPTAVTNWLSQTDDASLTDTGPDKGWTTTQLLQNYTITEFDMFRHTFN